MTEANIVNVVPAGRIHKFPSRGASSDWNILSILNYSRLNGILRLCGVGAGMKSSEYMEFDIDSLQTGEDATKPEVWYIDSIEYSPSGTDEFLVNLTLLGYAV